MSGGTLEAGASIVQAVSGTGTITAVNDLTIGKSSQAGQFNLAEFPAWAERSIVLTRLSFLLHVNLGSQTNLSNGGSLTTLNGSQLGNATTLDTTKVLTASGNATINGNFVNNGVVHGPGARPTAHVHAIRHGGRQHHRKYRVC